MIDTSKQVKEITYNGTPLVLYQEPQEGPVLQSKTVNIIANGTYTTTPDEGYDGLSSVAVTVNVPSSGGGGSSLLDEYDVAYINSTGTLTALTGTHAMKTRIVNDGTSYEYRLSLISNTIPVGANILDYVNEVIVKKTSIYCWPLYFQRTNEVQKELTMQIIRSQASQNVSIRKYSGVTYSAGTGSNYGNFIMYDKDGKCLFNGSVEDGITALNNKTIDISNGVSLGFTAYVQNGSHCSFIFN